jgi:hypothetical protein
MPDQEVQAILLPIILKLASNESSFYSRVAGVKLIASLYGQAGEMKNQLRAVFGVLSREETSMVKRSVGV